MTKQKQGMYPYEVRLIMRQNLYQSLINLFEVELKLLQEDEIEFVSVIDEELAKAITQEEENVKSFLSGLRDYLEEVTYLIALMQVGKTSDHDGRKP